MQQGLFRAGTALVLALPLGACSSFLGIHFAHGTSKAQRAEAAADAPAAGTLTGAGRALLTDGQPGLAIEAFQRALATDEPVAPAVNGLGVAYARLGRDDLAERFFREAMAADPANSRYSDNLILLTRSPSFAERNAAAIAAQANRESAELLARTESDEQTAKSQEAAAAPKEPAVGQIQRISRAEVHIATAPPQTAPLQSASLKVDSRFKPLVRVVLRTQEPQGFKPLLRFELPEAKPADLASRADH